MKEENPKEGQDLIEMLRIHHEIHGASICVKLAKENLCRVAEEYDGTAESTLRLQNAASDFKSAKLFEDISFRRHTEWKKEMDASLVGKSTPPSQKISSRSRRSKS